MGQKSVELNTAVSRKWLDTNGNFWVAAKIKKGANKGKAGLFVGLGQGELSRGSGATRLSRGSGCC